VKRFKSSLAKGERLLDRMLGAGIALEHDCGGALACASCLVVVREGAQALGPASADELDLLDRAEATMPGARLACQAIATGGEVDVERAPRRLPARVAGSAPVSVSASAAKFLAAQLGRHAGAVAVRLSVVPTGCSGLGYRVDPADAIRGDDTVFECGGVHVTVDALSLPYLQGTTVDLVQEGLARRLRFDNPNAQRRCGCGESFGA
jgi:iron-sulfur cluster assembly protein